MTRQQKGWVALGLLLVLWAWILWEQFFASTPPAEAATPPPAVAPELPTKTAPVASEATDPSSLLSYASPELLLAQEDRRELGVLRNPFMSQGQVPQTPVGQAGVFQGPGEGPVSSSSTNASSTAPQTTPSTREPQKAKNSYRWTSVVISGSRRTAIWGGKSYREGDTVPDLGKLIRVDEASVTVELLGGEIRRWQLSIQNSQHEPNPSPGGNTP